MDNFDFDSSDTLYVSYPTRGTIVEMTGETVDSYRVVSPGNFSIAMGMAVFDGILYTVEPGKIFGFYLTTAEEVYTYSPPPGSSDINSPTTVVAGDVRLYLLSFISGFVISWNITSQMPLASVPDLEAPTDAHPFANGLLVTTNFGQGPILNITGDNLETVEVLGNYPGATFLTGNDEDVYFGNYAGRSINRFIADGVVLEEAELISAGHDGLEGIALTPNGLSIVAVATLSGRVEKIEIATGEVSVLADGLEFMPALPNFLPFQWSNDVAADNDFAYVNVDGPTNAIYKFALNPPTEGSLTKAPTSSAGIISRNMAWTAMCGLFVGYGLML